MAWETSHSVRVDASIKKAWEFHVNIDENWNQVEGDAVEYIKLLGPYEAGTKGRTKMKGQDPVEWQLIEVIPHSKSITEFLLPDANIHFEFTFEAISEDQTLLTQRISLSGKGAESYVSMMEENFGQNLEAGMKKIADEMGKYGREIR